MAIAFVCVTVFLVGFRMVAILAFPMLAGGAWLIVRKHPKMFQLWGLSLNQKSYYDPRKKTEGLKHIPWFAKAGAACSIVPISRFVGPSIFALKGGGYGCLFSLTGLDEEGLTDQELEPETLVVIAVAASRKAVSGWTCCRMPERSPAESRWRTASS